MEAIPRSTWISSRRIGDAVVTLIADGSCWWNPRFPVAAESRRAAMPDADGEGRIAIAFTSAHLTVGGASIVIDPGFDDPGSSWDRAFGARWPGYTRTPGLAAALAASGIPPEEVSHVCITHAHDDHFAGVVAERRGQRNVRFPRARHFIGREDWEGNPKRVDQTTDLAARLGAVDRLGMLELVDGENEVVPGVTMIHAPGETPGHCIVRLRSHGESFYHVGDLFHHGCEVAHPDWMPPHREAAVLKRSREQVMGEAASSGGTVVFTHERFPGWGQIAAGPGGFRWERTDASGGGAP
jgi:glyoxylase-like metal-dependent hydrolase (beta-lactamase superfamily II)